MGEAIDGLAMMTIAFVWPDADRKCALELLDQLHGRRRDACGRFPKRRIQRGLDLRPFQRCHQLPGEGQRHQFRGREAQCGHVAKPVQKPPADAALDTLREQGKMGGFQRVEIAANRAGMFGEIGRKGRKEFIEGKAPRRPFQPLQHVPLTRDLIVARHDHRKRWKKRGKNTEAAT